MAWYNSLKDLTHDVGSIASNPFVDAGLGLVTGGAAIPFLAGAAGGAMKNGGNFGTAVTGGITGGLSGYGGDKLGGLLFGGMGGGAGGAGSVGGLSGAAKALGIGGGGGGGAPWTLGSTGLTLGDLLKFGGGAAAGVADYSQQEAARKQAAQQFGQTLDFQKAGLAQQGSQFGQNLDFQKAGLAQQGSQFDKTYGLQRNTQAAGVAQQLNRAPLADKGQYLATNFAAPTAFQPRDYTQTGMPQSGAPSGGAQAQLAANNAASMNYKAGAGGVNTDTLKMILARLG